MDDHSRDVEQMLLHPRDFRDNFWFSTLRRFLVFEEFMRLHPEPMLHIESDVLLSKDFPFSKFENVSQMFAFPLISNIQGIPSVLFLQSIEASIRLRSLTIAETVSNPATTDMLILRKLSEQSINQVLILPSGPSNNICYRQNTEKEYLKFQDVGLDFFEGIFDGAALGQYLFGDDPRNNRGIRNLFIDSKYSSLVASKLEFAFSPRSEFIEVKDGDVFRPVFSLHIHSKDVRAFSQNSGSKFLLMRLTQSKNGKRSEFVTKVAISQMFKSIKRRTLPKKFGTKV
jgi:hypothetical protein